MLAEPFGDFPKIIARWAAAQPDKPALRDDAGGAYCECLAVAGAFVAGAERALLGLGDKRGKGGALRFDREPLKRLVLPAYDAVIKCSHYFNVLDARGAISVTERQRYIGRVRLIARAVAESWYAQREALGFPLLQTATAAQ